MQVADVLIQAGHEGRTTGSTGTSSKWGAEIKWTPIIADETTRIPRQQGFVAQQALRGLRPAHDLAAPLGLHLGRGEVLL